MQTRIGRAGLRGVALGLVLLLGWGAALAQSLFTVATYNLENYLDHAAPGREPKPLEARAKIAEILLQIRPDVLAVQEIGRPSALLELRDRLAAQGLNLPHWEHVGGFDTNIFVGVLSRFPIVARRPHTNESFLLQGRRFRTSRGFAEVDIRVSDRYTFTLFTAHLKSRREVEYGDQAELRLQEALKLRALIEARLRANPQANLLVMGDFNDTKDQPPIRTLIGRDPFRLVDARPAERNGDTAPPPRPDWDPRWITWTHFYGKEDSYERIDYILISPGMAREWHREGSYVPNIPNWGVASDHRPVVATFYAEDR
jgi:endonuclease/exonuclease/phosphatase family metal-dependent hydrolase